LLTDDDPAAHLDSTIDMANTRAVRCRFEVANRCLLAMASPAFPIESPDVPAGAVKVVATINRSGRLEVMRALRSRASSGAAKSLTEAVIAHLSTWRFDPSSRSSPIEVAYRYVIDPDIIVPVIEVASAQQVTVRANPGITRQDLERIRRKGRPRLN
jgi:hypothetical protein